MRLSRAQRSAVDLPGNVAVVACPGSGKTRTLVAKLIRCIEQLRGSSRKVACITYTNAASEEVESRLKTSAIADYDDYCEISTIHAFCLSNVLRFFHWRIPEYKSGFEVVPPDSEAFADAVDQVCLKHHLQFRQRSNFELLNRAPNGAPIMEGLPAAAAEDFWRNLQGSGLIDFPNIVYYSYRLLVDYPEIAEAIAAKYAWFLVDEFQDTSALQVEIFQRVAAGGVTSFFLVGDPHQSIYRFAGARPDLFDSFAQAIGATCDSGICENWRSSQRIISQAETLCPRTPPMRAVGRNANCPCSPIYVHSPTTFAAITDYFLPELQRLGIRYGEAAILAPWWIKLLHLGRQLREYGVPILGPGARPYKRHHLLAPLLEEICAFIEESSPERIPTIEKELFWLISRTTGASDFTLFSYEGRKVVWALITAAQSLRDRLEGAAVEWLQASALQFGEILVTCELLPSACRHLLLESVQAMISEMIEHDVDTSNLTTAELSLFARHSNSIRLVTMHSAKGREFDAVAIIDLHDDRVPGFRANTPELVEDGRRLLYVAITRAKRLLMYVTDAERSQSQPSRFLMDDLLNAYRDRIIIAG